MGDPQKQDRVPIERWQQAQVWEREYWVSKDRLRRRFWRKWLWFCLSRLRLKPAHRGDDWNEWWSAHFNHYAFLPETVENAVELGCGPYTNMRIITARCRPRHLFLSDPLMPTYVGFEHTFVSEMYRTGGCIVDDHPIEQCPFPERYFDLVVLINVLDHVQDAGLCIQKTTALVKDGGILILGQELSDPDDAERGRESDEETGHPIKVDQLWIESYLAPFDPIIQRVLPREAGRRPSLHYGTLIYAGRRRLG